MELAGAVWADLFLGSLALVIRPLFYMLPTLHKRRFSIMALYRNGRGNLLNGSRQGLSVCSFGKRRSCDQKWQCLAEIIDMQREI